MRKKLATQTVFISKSLLWSLLLYATVMAIVNWDELSAGKNKAQDNQSWVKKNGSNEKELIPVKAAVNGKVELMAYVKKVLGGLF